MRFLPVTACLVIVLSAWAQTCGLHLFDAGAEEGAGTVRANLDQSDSEDPNSGIDVGPFERKPSISADGRFVVFYSEGALVGDDTNTLGDIFVRDLLSGATERVSLDENNAQFPEVGCDGYKNTPATLSERQTISEDGRYVLFNAYAGVGGCGRVPYLRDRLLQVTQRVPDGVRLSADGSTLALYSDERLSGDDLDGGNDIYLWDRESGAYHLVTRYSYSIHERLRLGPISGDGRFVVFGTDNDYVLPGTEPFSPMGLGDLGNIYIYDAVTEGVERIDVGPLGELAAGFSDDLPIAAISRDARFVAFTGDMTLIGGDREGSHVFLRDRLRGQTSLLDVNASGEPSAGLGTHWLGVSDYGRYVSFTSSSLDLVPNTWELGRNEVYIRDTVLGVTERVDIPASGYETLDDLCHVYLGTSLRDECGSSQASVDATGRRVVFSSEADYLVPGDGNGQADVFVRDRCPDGGCEDRPEPSATPTPFHTIEPPTPTVTATPEGPHKYVIFLEGIGSDLTALEVSLLTRSECPDFANDPSKFRSYKLGLLSQGFSCKDFLYFSYNGGYVDNGGYWRPARYRCEDTGQSLRESRDALRSMLLRVGNTHPGAEFHLVGHSLGGVIALELLDLINGGEYSGARVASVSTLDSPLNHLSKYNRQHLKDRLVLTGDVYRACNLSLLLRSKVAGELANLTTANKARIKEFIASRVRQAQRNGITIATLGNAQDCLWFLDHCEYFPGEWIDDTATQTVPTALIQQLYDLGNAGCVHLAFCVGESHTLILEYPVAVNDVRRVVGAQYP